MSVVRLAVATTLLGYAPTRSIVLNRNKMRKAREALKALPPEQREELRYQGIGPDDSYVGMWRIRRPFHDRCGTRRARSRLPPMRSCPR
jgi:hypothetical protein